MLQQPEGLVVVDMNGGSNDEELPDGTGKKHTVQAEGIR